MVGMGRRGIVKQVQVSVHSIRAILSLGLVIEIIQSLPDSLEVGVLHTTKPSHPAPSVSHAPLVAGSPLNAGAARRRTSPSSDRERTANGMNCPGSIVNLQQRSFSGFDLHRIEIH